METAPRMPLKRAAALEIQSAKGMVHMGGRASVRVSLWLFPLFPFCRTTPPSNQVEPGKTLPSVKLKNPNLPGFGTVPFVLALFHHRQLPPFGFTAAGQYPLAPRPTPCQATPKLTPTPHPPRPAPRAPRSSGSAVDAARRAGYSIPPTRR